MRYIDIVLDQQRQRLSFWRGIKNAIVVTIGAAIVCAALYGALFL